MHLLRFSSEAMARSGLGTKFEAAMPTSLVTTDAVFDEDGALVSDRETLAGYWLLAAESGLFGEVATLTADGSVVISTVWPEIIGARIDPILAGMVAAPLAMAPEPEPAPEPVPALISDRQFAQQLAVLGTITWEEAIAWAARGDLPPAMTTAISSLPEEQRNPARMLLSSATTYGRAHPLVPLLGAILGYDEAELDDIWRAASQL